MLTVRGVSLYQSVKALVKDVNFQVNKSDIVTIMGPSGSGKSSLFSWMIGALSPQFQASGELWLNERRIDTLPTAQRQIGILFQMRCCLTISALGRIYCWPYPPACKVPPDAMRLNALSHALTSQVFIRAIRRHSPADNARVSPCSVHYWRSPGHCYSMNPLAGWMRRYAITFANGSSPRCVSWGSRWYR